VESALRDNLSHPATLHEPWMAATGSWISEHAVLMALVWPMLLVAIFLPLSVRTYRRLNH